MSSREVSGDRPHREQAAPVTPRQDAYLQWRQRIADKQATRRQPEEAPTAKPSSRWDPEALFRVDEPTTIPSKPATVPSEPAADRAPTIDLRDRAEAPVTRAPLDPPPAPSPRPAGRPGRDPRKERLDSVMARLGASAPAQQRPATGTAASPRPRDPGAPSVDLTPIGEALRQLNEERLDGTVTDEEFNRRKAEIFERASRR